MLGEGALRALWMCRLGALTVVRRWHDDRGQYSRVAMAAGALMTVVAAGDSYGWAARTSVGGCSGAQTVEETVKVAVQQIKQVVVSRTISWTT